MDRLKNPPDPELFKPSKPTRADRAMEDRPVFDQIGGIMLPGCPWYDDCLEAAAKFNMSSTPCSKCENSRKK